MCLLKATNRNPNTTNLRPEEVGGLQSTESFHKLPEGLATAFPFPFLSLTTVGASRNSVVIEVHGPVAPSPSLSVISARVENDVFEVEGVFEKGVSSPDVVVAFQVFAILLPVDEAAPVSTLALCVTGAGGGRDSGAGSVTNSGPE
jgi:hypothetical protein